jgi:hypothetical protein
MNVGIMILFIAILLFGILAFLQVSALILAPLVSIFVIIFSMFPTVEGGVTLLSGLKDLFMPAASA